MERRRRGGWREMGVGNELIVYGKLPYGITGTQARFSGSEGTMMGHLTAEPRYV